MAARLSDQEPGFRQKLINSLSGHVVYGRKAVAGMLVLTRKKGQSIMVGDEIEISVVEINGDAIRLGIKAPRSVSIYRREIYEAILEENIRAAGTSARMAEKLKTMQLKPNQETKTPQKDDKEQKE